MIEKIELTKKDVKILPEIADAVIIDIEKKTAIEVYGREVKEPLSPVLVLTYENHSLGIRGTEPMAYYEEEKLTNNTALGKFLLKYGELKVGTMVVLKRTEKGFYKIHNLS
jgi:hypothetical protein